MSNASYINIYRKRDQVKIRLFIKKKVNYNFSAKNYLNTYVKENQKSLKLFFCFALFFNKIE